MRWGDDQMSGWGWFGGTLMMLIMVGLLVWAIMVIARRPTRDAAAVPPPPSESAISLLDRRLANGEIDLDDYHARSEALGRRDRRD